jgi:spermidine/putrescine transport system substrate-binding protein
VRRRDLLILAAGAAVAGGCARPDAAGDEAQRLEPGSLGRVRQRLDPRLELSLPDGAVAAASVRAFARRTGVDVRVRPQESDDRLLLDLAAAPGLVDVALVEQRALSYLVTAGQVQPLARSLVPNAELVESPWDDPPFDPGSRHSVPKDYAPIGFAVAPAMPVGAGAGWDEFFALAGLFPGRIVVPDDPDAVIGAALVAAGHGWNAELDGELEDARDVLVEARDGLVLGAPLERTTVAPYLAAMCVPTRFLDEPLPPRFVVPDRTVVRLRSYCIPIYARSPVSAHAWLDFTLAPANAAADVRRSLRPSAVGAARFLLPAALLADPLVYPPADVLDGLGFAAVSDAGRAARSELWDEVWSGPGLG